MLNILSLVLYTSLSSTLVIVGNAPSVKEYMHTWEVENNVLSKLQSENPTWDIRLLKPDCTDCAALVNMTENLAVQTLLNLTWSDAEVTAMVERELKTIPDTQYPVTVVALDFQMTDSLISSHTNATFRNVMSNESVISTPSTLIVSTEMAAYTNGVLAGLTASTGYKRVGIMASGEISNSLVAFWQGVVDADPDICVTFDMLNIESIFTWNSDSYDDTTDHAKEHKLTDVLYTQLGAYDTAVLAAVKNRSESNYATYAITGAWSGASIDREKLGDVWLSRNLLNWAVLLQEIGINGNNDVGDQSQSQWTAPWSTRMSNLTEDHPIRKERVVKCPGDAAVTHSDIIDSIASLPLPSIAGRKYSPNADSKCQSQNLTVLSPQVREQIDNCLAETSGKVRLVGVAMYINNLGNVDMKGGSFYVDFNLYLHQSKLVYASMEDIETVLAEEERLNGMGACRTELCACPDLGTNKWENYIPANDTSSFDTIVNLVNVDRVRSITPVFKYDAEETLVDYYRVQGTHYFMPELKQWPMDSQSLRIILEDLQESASDLRTIRFCHMAHFAGLSPNARYFPGMELSVGNSPWAVETTSSCWPYLKYPTNYVEGFCHNGLAPSDENLKYLTIQGGDLSCTCLGGTKASSRYTFSITFDRPAIPSFMKAFLPAIFIMLVNQGVWFLHPRVFETRLGVCGSSLISGVMYHVSVTSNTPETSVLTWADRFMIVVYFNNLIAFVAVFYQTVLFQGELKQLAWDSFRLSRIWGPLMTLCTFMGVVLFSSPRSVVIWVIGSSGVIFLIIRVIGDKILRGVSPAFLRWMRNMNEKIGNKKVAKAERVFSSSSQSGFLGPDIQEDPQAIQLT
eukprot:TRINITY_DN13355_c3_g1_i1.p1 TRINITY_DN13355_c3_g1~~TRINITY_DN13355_c3_g1_i1.p1  ORF type:complete len:854 (+),score=108.23 TRINITY_DN13355_c3_g1_i1:92-2653(+)